MTRIIKVLSVSLLLAALVSMIASCASQETYERVTSEDCLVLIPTEIVGTDGLQLTRDYFLHFSDGQKRRKISKVKDDLLPVIISGDGVAISSLSSSVSSGGQHNVVGGTTEFPLDLALPYAPGKVVVYEYTFVQSYEKTDGAHYLSRWGFNKTPEEKIPGYLAEFGQRPEAGSWTD